MPGGTADPRNNVESVFLPAGTLGSFSVRITAANINSDGVPGVGGPVDQDFALVVYNANEEPQPAVVYASGATLVAESCGVGNGAIDPGETVSVGFALANLGTLVTTDLVATLLLVESNKFITDKTYCKKIIKKSLSNVFSNKVDVATLSSTHLSFLNSILSSEFPHIKFIDPANDVAKKILTCIKNESKKNTIKIFTSGERKIISKKSTKIRNKK